MAKTERPLQARLLELERQTGVGHTHPRDMTDAALERVLTCHYARKVTDEELEAVAAGKDIQ